MSTELSGKSRRSVRPHHSAALPSTIPMDSYDEEVDDAGQGELGAVVGDVELGDWDDEDEGHTHTHPSAQGRRDPHSGRNRSAQCDTFLPRCGAPRVWRGRNLTHHTAESRIKAETSLKLVWTTHLCEVLMGEND